MHGGSGPLRGVKVVELGVWVAGPAAAGILADWGAEVIKIEPPGGDPARMFAAMLGGDLPSNPVFELDNRSKRSIALDLSRAEGREVAEQLIAGADVFVTNIRPAALEKLGLDPATLRHRHPAWSTPSSPGTASPDPTPTVRPMTSPRSGPVPDWPHP